MAYPHFFVVTISGVLLEFKNKQAMLSRYTTRFYAVFIIVDKSQHIEITRIHITITISQIHYVIFSLTSYYRTVLTKRTDQSCSYEFI